MFRYRAAFIPDDRDRWRVARGRRCKILSRPRHRRAVVYWYPVSRLCCASVKGRTGVDLPAVFD
ncbi:Uncharacterised protein [Vibrio cholerae]|nr:Uncharacterised protein [Vibrio cholerae]